MQKRRRDAAYFDKNATYLEQSPNPEQADDQHKYAIHRAGDFKVVFKLGVDPDRKSAAHDRFQPALTDRDGKKF